MLRARRRLDPRFAPLFGIVALWSTHADAQSLPTSPSTVLAPLAGRHYTPAPGQATIGFYGTDLGFTFKHEGQLRVLFGDTWANANGTGIGPLGDDSQGAICLSATNCPGGAGAPTFADGDQLISYVNAHPPAAGELPWQKDGPPLYFRTNAFGLVAPLPVYRGNSTLLTMGPGRTPVAGFSNAKTGQSSAAFGIFFRNVALQCSGGLFPSCPDSFSCDLGMGSVLGVTNEDAAPCTLGTVGCSAIPARGFCVDPTTAAYDGTPLGRLLSVVHKLQVGNADKNLHEVYYTRDWNTRKFYNPTVRTVNDFVKSRANGLGNDYNAPDSTTTGREKLLIWGRPTFAGARNNGHSAKLYFAIADLPSFDGNGNFVWSPEYFTGTDAAGVPQFSSNQTLAKALDLSGLADGLAGADAEKWDVADQVSIAYVSALNKWVMLYGGDVNAGLADLFSGGQGAQVQRDPEGAIHVRWTLADDPWGPWSKPQQLFKAGNPNTTPPVAGTQYAPGGILHHPGCVGATCAPYEAPLGPSDFGFLYAPNIVEQWTEDRGTYVELFWNVSTWDPYQIVLMKSRINK